MGNVVARKMRRSDLAAVSDLALLANPHAEKTSYNAHLEEELRDNPELAFVAVEDGKIVGYVMGDVHGSHAVLEDIAVDEARQNLGIGRMLLETELGALRTTEAEAVRAEVHYKCASAIPFYYKHGFRISGVCRNFFGMGHDAIILELLLAKTERK